MANTYPERWIGTIRRELLDRTIIWNQHQLEQLVVGYIGHYNQHRPHRSLDQQPPLAPKAPPPDATASSTNTKTQPDQPRHNIRPPHARNQHVGDYIHHYNNHRSLSKHHRQRVDETPLRCCFAAGGGETGQHPSEAEQCRATASQILGEITPQPCQAVLG